MKIVNNTDRTIHFVVQGPFSKTVWEEDLSEGSNTEKQLSDSVMSCSTTFKTDPPQLAGSTKGGLSNKSIVIISQVYCGVSYG